MSRMRSKRSGLALVLGTALVMSACAKKDNAATDTGMVADAGVGAMADTGMAAAPAPALTDPNIVYVLDMANHLDSMAGSVAATKGTAADVRDYGKMMMRDHHKLRQSGDSLAKKLGVTSEAPAGDTHEADVQKTMSMLNTAAKGKDFDKAYIDNEVIYHQAVLQTATTAMGVAQNPELKNLIQKAAPLIQAHLDKAKAIQSKMQ
jgi:putative membrane protein